MRDVSNSSSKHVCSLFLPLCTLLSTCLCQRPPIDKDSTRPLEKSEQCVLNCVSFVTLSRHTRRHTHAHSPTAADTIVQLIVISAAQVEKCLFKVRTARVFEDNDTQESLEYRFCASLKAPLCAC